MLAPSSSARKEDLIDTQPGLRTCVLCGRIEDWSMVLGPVVAGKNTLFLQDGPAE